MQNLNLKPGKWLYANCGDMPSEKNCQLVMMAPIDQKADLVEAGIAHMVKAHGHTDTPELRNEAEKMFKEMQVE